MFPILAGNSASTGYNLTRSLRFRSAATASLSRTPASAGNRQTWTWSAWVKRGSLGSVQMISHAGNNGGTDTGFYFNTDNTLQFYNSSAGTVNGLITTLAVFRDPSAWYHVVVVFDTTNATATSRMRIYVNNVLQTVTVNTQIAQNTSGSINNTVINRIGVTDIGSYFDGYLTEVNFIDGQALTPSSFGSTNALTGVWQPAAYTGSYGTNGFELQFTDNSGATATTIGKDSSGNGNNWTPNNISVTAGVTYDSMTDVPTLTSATAANFCVINPLDKGNTPSRLTISNGNLTATWDTTAGSCASLASVAVSSGKWYWEATFVSGNYGTAGILKVGDSKLNYIGSTSGGYSYANDGNKVNNGSFTAYGASYTSGDVIGIALDLTAGTLVFYKNGVSQGTAFSGISGLYQPALSDVAFAALVYTLNFGQRPFAYTPPTGFVALNTFNLPTSTIIKGNTVMDATLYTGNGSTQTITNAAGFKPDLVWAKARSSAAWWHILVDSVRGVGRTLSSNVTNAEGGSGSDCIPAINSNGFNVNVTPNASVNENATTYVAWQWQAGQGSSSSNTNGTITSTVSVNASAGFSVATYTAQASGTGTVGHGLGVAPSLIITKPRANAFGWTSYHASLGNTQYIELNTTSAAATASSVWNNTSPTSSVFTSGSAFAGNGTYVAYCWTPIAGFSAFGSYTGNGSADGPFVYTGFRPKWIMIKRTDSAEIWGIRDSARNGYNSSTPVLFANASDAEYSNAGFFEADILSNGFKIRNIGSGANSSGGTYIYMAFAENPFKNSLAR